MRAQALAGGLRRRRRQRRPQALQQRRRHRRCARIATTAHVPHEHPSPHPHLALTHRRFGDCRTNCLQSRTSLRQRDARTCELGRGVQGIQRRRERRLLPAGGGRRFRRRPPRRACPHFDGRLLAAAQAEAGADRADAGGARRGGGGGRGDGGRGVGRKLSGSREEAARVEVAGRELEREAGQLGPPPPPCTSQHDAAKRRRRPLCPEAFPRRATLLPALSTALVALAPTGHGQRCEAPDRVRRPVGAQPSARGRSQKSARGLTRLQRLRGGRAQRRLLHHGAALERHAEPATHQSIATRTATRERQGRHRLPHSTAPSTRIALPNRCCALARRSKVLPPQAKRSAAQDPPTSDGARRKSSAHRVWAARRCRRASRRSPSRASSCRRRSSARAAASASRRRSSFSYSCLRARRLRSSSHSLPP